jgi:D-arabinose 1-dehydrogenase-like Zn-dependent alcohol dehydrogenase
VIKTEPVVIIGAGGLGLICIAVLKAMKGKGAIVVDIEETKRDAARRAGALATIDGRAPDAFQKLRAAAKGPVWAVVDFVGSTQTVKLGFESLAKGGRQVIVGLFGGDITLPIPYIPMRAATVQGSYTGSLGELAELVKLIRNLPLPLLPTRTTRLDSAQDILNELKANKVVGRVVLTPAP